MRLRVIGYQMHARLRNIVPCFHKSHVTNLSLMVVGMVFAQSVSLPAVARYIPLSSIQIEGRVQRLERLLTCPKLCALDVLEPVVRRLLAWLAKRQSRLVIVMDRSLIRNDFNFLYVAVAFGRRSLTLGWVRLPHVGTSDLAVQKRVLTWLGRCLPEGAEVWIVADREFHSIHLAHWIDQALGCRPGGLHALQRRQDMRADLVVGGHLPDLELSDHRRQPVRLSKLAAGYPLIVSFCRGYW
jgi:hypothetical protein